MEETTNEVTNTAMLYLFFVNEPVSENTLFQHTAKMTGIKHETIKQMITKQAKWKHDDNLPACRFLYSLQNNNVFLWELTEESKKAILKQIGDEEYLEFVDEKINELKCKMFSK